MGGKAGLASNLTGTSGETTSVKTTGVRKAAVKNTSFPALSCTAGSSAAEGAFAACLLSRCATWLRSGWSVMLWGAVISATSISLVERARGAEAEAPAKLVLVAGKPSHPPRMHEFNAGVQLLTRCLQEVPGLKTEFVLNGWPADEKVFEDAAAVVFYMDGGGGHEVVQEGRRRLEMVDSWAQKGVGLGFMHFGVEVVPDQAGAEFKKWIAGHYEHLFSCNPIWEPTFTQFPEHPITRGVEPFQVKDEWYFNMRFVGNMAGNEPAQLENMKFTPILVAAPSDQVRNGPYVYPPGPYEHIQAAQGRAEAMMWAVDRADGGRGFGFTGGHFHDNWGNANFRKVVLNALVWLTKRDVPAQGVASEVSAEQLDANLDPKR